VSAESGARAVPFHCPYCGDEDLRPHEDKHGAWECRSCLRAFSLKFLGLLTPPTTGQVN
jgi:transposase-like protein